MRSRYVPTRLLGWSIELVVRGWLTNGDTLFSEPGLPKSRCLGFWTDDSPVALCHGSESFARLFENAGLITCANALLSNHDRIRLLSNEEKHNAEFLATTCSLLVVRSEDLLGVC